MHEPAPKPVATTVEGARSTPTAGRAQATGSERRTYWSDSSAFLRGFLAHPSQVGSIIPSSHLLEQRLVRAAEVRSARTIVELGPGTGGTTRALLGAMPAESRLLAIELSPAFHARLSDRLRDSRLILQLGSAEELIDRLRAWRLPAPNAIVSGIPFSTMPPEVAANIAAGISEALAPGGRFVAYQVRADVARYMRPHFGDPLIEWEWINVPPLRVFSWTKPIG